MVASTVLLLPAAIVGAPSEAPGLGPIAAVAALGVLGTGIAFAIFYDLIANVGPARTFVVTYLAPAFAVVYGAVLLDEAITVATLLGLALIVGGSYLAAEGRLSLLPPAARRRTFRRRTKEPESRAIRARSHDHRSDRYASDWQSRRGRRRSSWPWRSRCYSTSGSRPQITRARTATGRRRPARDPQRRRIRSTVVHAAG